MSFDLRPPTPTEPAMPEGREPAVTGIRAYFADRDRPFRLIVTGGCGVLRVGQMVTEAVTMRRRSSAS
ncbi:hypothetical protein, partial [Tahibacter caeni]|uniref:hypothetical protein n=1 Tax=Tahibacter caeni TaxID=1453545 RepID=UPI002148F2FD